MVSVADLNPKMPDRKEVTMSTPQETLRALLNTRVPAALSTPCASESEQQTSDQTPKPARQHPRHFRIIGRGTCGTVYEHSLRPSEVAIKVGPDLVSLKRDFNHALRAHNAARACRSVLRDGGPLVKIPLPLVPRPRKQLNDNDLGALGEKGLCLEALDAETCEGDPRVFRRAEIPAAWEGERIGAVAAEVRDALVDLYVDPEQRVRVRAEDESRDCLVRIYLGAESSLSARYHLDELRNAPLHLDQMRALGLHVRGLAEEMACGLAVCHWGAELDGMDVEFVLGGPRAERYRDRGEQAGPRPAASMWMLDYDKTTLVSHHGRVWGDEQMVERFAVAAHGNDPYFPRPGLDRALWDRFVEVYVLAARSIIVNGSRISNDKMQRLLGLPEMVMTRLGGLYEEEERWRRDAQDLVSFDENAGENGGGWASDEVDDNSDTSESD